MLNQKATQSNLGNTEAYKSFGTYVKSFYSVMVSPSILQNINKGVSLGKEYIIK